MWLFHEVWFPGGISPLRVVDGSIVLHHLNVVLNAAA